MSKWSPPEVLRGGTPAVITKSWPVDAVIAAVAGVVVLVITGLVGRWRHEPLDLIGYLWLAVPAVALVFRTRLPWLVFVITGSLTAAYFFWAPYPYGPLPVLSMIALVTLSYVRGPLLAGATGLAIVVLAQVVAWRFDGVAVGMLLWITAGTSIGAALRARQERSVERSHRIAEKERLYLAREVHDVVAHSLAMINVQAGVGAHIADNRPDQAKEALLAIKEASRVALADLRATLSVVRSGDRSPVPHLDRMPELISAATSAGLQVDVQGEPGDLPAHVSFTAYRILQESLTNAVRHARGADTVVVEFSRPDRSLDMRVTDNGIGATVTTGNGLRGMRERAEALGGTLTAGPGERGFQVRAVLPLRGES